VVKLPQLGPATDLSIDNENVCVVSNAGGVQCVESIFSKPGPVERLAPGNDYKRVVTASNHSCMLRANGTVACVGNPGHHYSYYRYPEHEHQPVGGLHEIDLPGAATDIDVSSGHACAVLADGSLHCWGSNRHGELGVGPTSCRERPLDITDAILNAAQAH
jgi:hypothetical protein